jgi:hypothetical protein
VIHTYYLVVEDPSKVPFYFLVFFWGGFFGGYVSLMGYGSLLVAHPIRNVT